MDYNQLINNLLSSSNQLYSIAADREKTKQAAAQAASDRAAQERRAQQQQQQFQQEMAANERRSLLARQQYAEGAPQRAASLQGSLLENQVYGQQAQSQAMDLEAKQRIESIRPLASQPDKYLEQLRIAAPEKAQLYEEIKEKIGKQKIDADKASQELAFTKLTAGGTVMNNMLSLPAAARLEYIANPENKELLNKLGMPKEFDYSNEQHLVAGLTVAGKAMDAVKNSPELVSKYLNKESFQRFQKQFQRERQSEILKDVSQESASKAGLYSEAINHYDSARNLIFDKYGNADEEVIDRIKANFAAKKIWGVDEILQTFTPMLYSNDNSMKAVAQFAMGQLQEGIAISGANTAVREGIKIDASIIPTYGESAKVVDYKFREKLKSLFNARDTLITPEWTELKGLPTKESEKFSRYFKEVPQEVQNQVARPESLPIQQQSNQSWQTQQLLMQAEQLARTPEQQRKLAEYKKRNQ